MGTQLPLFGATEPDASERLNRELAEMRLQEQARAETRPRSRPIHRRKYVTRCPSCGARVTIDG